jgi:hypothetical protein
MNTHDENRIEQLLKHSLPPTTPSAEPSRDLWPAVLRRLGAESASTAPGLLRRNWFDLALLAGLIVFAAVFPATIPVFLYYL